MPQSVPRLAGEWVDTIHYSDMILERLWTLYWFPGGDASCHLHHLNFSENLKTLPGNAGAPARAGGRVSALFLKPGRERERERLLFLRAACLLYCRCGRRGSRDEESSLEAFASLRFCAAASLQSSRQGSLHLAEEPGLGPRAPHATGLAHWPSRAQSKTWHVQQSGLDRSSPKRWRGRRQLCSLAAFGLDSANVCSTCQTGGPIACTSRTLQCMLLSRKADAQQQWKTDGCIGCVGSVSAQQA